MKSLSSKTIDSFLHQNPQGILGFIQKKVSELKKINQLWQIEVSADLVQHSRVANFREGCLVIEVDSAAWATRLRYLIPDLNKNLVKNPLLNTLKHIEWYIQPNFYPCTEKKPLMPALTTASSQLLQIAAENIKIKSLQTALTRLSRNT